MKDDRLNTSNKFKFNSNMKKKNIIVAMVVLLGMGSHIAFGQQAGNSQAEISDKFNVLLGAQFKNDGPGCAALVAKEGKVIYKNAFGMANLELDVPMKPEMVFRIGSITKQFTAVAILQLAEQGKLSLQDTITKFIPDYPVNGKTITIEHLLTHTSGIKSYTGMTEWTAELQKKDFTPEELIGFFKNQPMDFDPGRKFLYNNSGYILLGYIVAKASGMEYGQYLSEHIFKPAGMKHSAYEVNSILVKNRAYGYAMGDNGVEDASYLSMTQPYAAGSIISTVEDLYAWNRAIRDNKLVSKSSIDRAFSVYKLFDGTSTGYGYGWGIGEIKGSRCISHGGGINGFLTQSIYLPEEDVFVAVFSNSEFNSPDNVAMKMAALAIGKYTDYKEITLDSATMSLFAGVYENENGDQRVISLKEGQLFSMRTGGSKVKITPYDKNKFFFSEGMATYEFISDEGGKVKTARVERIGIPAGNWTRTDKPVPVQTEISMDPKSFEKYAGEYELAPGFTLKVFLDGTHLMTQATGQQAFEIFAEASGKFFLKVVDAKIEFIDGKNGLVEKLILYQGGTHEAKKIK